MGHDCGPSLLQAGARWRGEPAHLPEGPGGWTMGRPVLPLAEHLRWASPGFQEEPLAVGQVVISVDISLFIFNVGIYDHKIPF